MINVTGKSFRDQTEILDGNSYDQCTFANCRLVYWGGPPPQITRCSFERCSWEFDDAASRTVGFMRALYHGMGAGGRQIIEGTFKLIRTPPAGKN